MKKMILVFAAAAFSCQLFALDLTAGLRGLAGGAKYGTDNPKIGGAVMTNLEFKNGFGVQFEADIVTAELSGDNGGLHVENCFVVNIPVMGWYTLHFGRFALGGGVGINGMFGDDVVDEDNLGFRLGLAAGFSAKYFITENFALGIGATGLLDCLLHLTKNDGTYRFESPDWNGNALLGFIGAEYRFKL